MSIIKILDTARYLRYFGIKLPRTLSLVSTLTTNNNKAQVGDNFTISAEITPESSIPNAGLQWSCSGPIELISQDDNNTSMLVKCNGIGNYSITATTVNNLTYTYKKILKW